MNKEKNSIPNYKANGRLPEGVHKCSGEEFLARFLFNDYRKDYRKTIVDIFDYAKEYEVDRLFIGGSFITNIDKPSDIDCLIIVEKDEYIPEKAELLQIEGIRLDIQFASLQNKEVANCYIGLFTHDRYGKNIGIIEIDLYNGKGEWTIEQYSTDQYEIIKRAYIDRKMVDLNSPRGILVTIHGLYSVGRWNQEFAPIVSSQKWIFAPYIYENNNVFLLANSKKRNEIIDDFRSWIFNLQERFEEYKISIVAHSFGTYIIASYLEGFYDCQQPISFDSIILTGSIINKDFDWEKHRGKSVGKVLNIKAPNDEWVKFMSNGILDKTMGNSGVNGFNNKSSILEEYTANIFNHTNVIKRDIIISTFMPFLNLNCGALRKAFGERWDEENERINV